MATQESSPRTGEARQTVLVNTFTDGLLGPEVPMLGPVADGGHTSGTRRRDAGGR